VIDGNFLELDNREGSFSRECSVGAAVLFWSWRCFEGHAG
jgi:hypothetical protein